MTLCQYTVTFEIEDGIEKAHQFEILDNLDSFDMPQHLVTMLRGWAQSRTSKVIRLRSGEKLSTTSRPRSGTARSSTGWLPGARGSASRGTG